LSAGRPFDSRADLPDHARKKVPVARFTVSVPAELLRELDRMAAEKGYNNRSLAVADMIRDELVEHRQRTGQGEIVGTLTLVYDHHTRHVQETLTELQHEHHERIISTVHVHLDAHHCLEVLLMRGPAPQIKRIADALIAARGVKHGKLTVTTTGHDLPG
jgi:CopG family nickel-responsive transcriptional regulator